MPSFINYIKIDFYKFYHSKIIKVHFIIPVLAMIPFLSYYSVSPWNELDKVISFFYQCLDASDRYDFMIISPEGKIIGESVINEIDNDLRSANFRICLFHPTDYGKGIGTWALEKTRDFAFQELHLHRLELNVFSFNVRAIKAYKHAGFRQEGILKDAIKDGDKYADNILMAILEDEWKSCK